MTARSIGRPAPEAASPGRRLAAWLHGRPRLQLALLLGRAGAVDGDHLRGSLDDPAAECVLEATDAFSGTGRVPEFSLESFETLLTNDVYRTITLAHGADIAAAVTVTDILLGFPIAYYMARIASRRTRRILLIGVLLPLWASYLVKIYAWRIILQGNGVLDWVLAPFGISGPGLNEVSQLHGSCFSYLGLPLHDPAHLCRSGTDSTARCSRHPPTLAGAPARPSAA